MKHIGCDAHLCGPSPDSRPTESASHCPLLLTARRDDPIECVGASWFGTVKLTSGNGFQLMAGRIVCYSRTASWLETDGFERRHVQWPRIDEALQDTPTRCALETKKPTTVTPLARSLGVARSRSIQLGHIRDGSRNLAVRLRGVDHRGAPGRTITFGHFSRRPALLGGDCRIAAISNCVGLGNSLLHGSVPCSFPKHRPCTALHLRSRTRSGDSALDFSFTGVLAGILGNAQA